MKPIRHIFFDLDRTLWDFEANSKTVLEMLYRDYNLQRFFPNFLLFYEKYKSVNEEMWQKYYKKEITKDDVRLLRFYETVGTEKAMCVEMSQNYIETSVLQTAVFPDTNEVLTALKERNYTLHILSNGFREVQDKKLKNCHLSHFFTTVTTSEDADHHKPHPKAFEYALKQANAKSENAAMIGDDTVTDIEGAVNSGLYAIFFNPKRLPLPNKADIEIHELKSLLEIFR